MSFYYHEEPQNSSKLCKFLQSTLKEAFSHCHSSGKRPPSSNPEEEDMAASDFDDEQEEVVSEIRSRYMEAKSRRKASFTLDSYCWMFSPATGELFIAPKLAKQEESDDEDGEDFCSVKTNFSHCSRSSATTSVEVFRSVKTNFSRSSSLNRLDFPEFGRLSIVREFRHCEGWPFGLCRKALLLPPLPKSPSESWLWCKSTARTVRSQ